MQSLNLEPKENTLSTLLNDWKTMRGIFFFGITNNNKLTIVKIFKVPVRQNSKTAYSTSVSHQIKSKSYGERHSSQSRTNGEESPKVKGNTNNGPKRASLVDGSNDGDHNENVPRKGIADDSGLVNIVFKA